MGRLPEADAPDNYGQGTPEDVSSPDNSWLQEAMQRARYYQALGRKPTEIHPRDRLSFKLERWGWLVQCAAFGFDARGRTAPWHEPLSGRLASLEEHLLACCNDKREVREMISWLHRHVGERNGPFGYLARVASVDNRLPACIQDNRLQENLLYPVNPAWRDWLRALAHFCGALSVGHGEPLGKLLDERDLSRLLSACLRDKDAAGFRDAAMFITLYCTAASLKEIETLSADNWIPYPPSLHISSATPIRRNGDGAFAERVVPLTSETANLVTGWLALRGRGEGSMFLHVDAHGAPYGHGIRPATLHAALRKRSAQARIDPVRPEDLRRTGLTDLFRQGADLLSVSNAAGHSRLSLTETYRPGRSKRKTALP